jgi:mannose-6-phosphate isomerase
MSSSEVSVPDTPQLLETVVQHYAWGSRTLIPALLGLPAPAAEPWAELWVGAHPGGPSRLPDGRSLADVEPDLPYLLKLLSAVEPLSLQAHPDAEQARTGFAEEEAAGTPYDAPNRTFKDPNAKPELIVALTPFDAMCGFRAPADAQRLVAGLACPELAPLLDALGDPDPAVALMRAFTLEMLGLSGSDRAGHVLASVAGAAAMRAASTDTDPDDSVVYGWLARLAVSHRGDASALAPLLLNVIHLEPGTGVFLPARHLHAYLAGAGVEVMGNSDNVVRGGLTPKYVDVPRLLDIVDFTPQPIPVVRPRRVAEGVDAYDVPVLEFSLYRVHVLGAPVTLALGGPRIVLSTAGVVDVWDFGGSVSLRPGRAAYISASSRQLVIGGEGTAFVVAPGSLPDT